MANDEPSKSATAPDADKRTLRPASDAKKETGLKPHYENSWAIVIGINGYQSKDIRHLDYPVSDADGMARLLRGPLGLAAERMFVVLDPPPAGGLPYPLHAEHATKAVRLPSYPQEARRWTATKM